MKIHIIRGTREGSNQLKNSKVKIEKQKTQTAVTHTANIRGKPDVLANMAHQTHSPRQRIITT